MLTIGFSPCPNDTFMFDALIHGKIDTEGLEFKAVLADVETLNEKTLKGELDITKLSYYAYAYCNAQYALLTSGSALGFGVGPLLISKKAIKIKDVDQCSIAIPGKLTTAHFLLSLAFPNAVNKKQMAFSAIENAVLSDETDLGLIIHENRFTYQDKGLHKVIDLGEYWEQETHCAIPLGAIAVRRDIDATIQQKINRVLQRSINFAFENPESSKDFVKMHAQEMSEEVMQNHINLYVNKYSVDLGEEGKKAVETLYAKAEEKGLIDPLKNPLFI